MVRGTKCRLIHICIYFPEVFVRLKDENQLERARKKCPELSVVRCRSTFLFMANPFSHRDHDAPDCIVFPVFLIVQ
jgi:hypothetical protein